MLRQTFGLFHVRGSRSLAVIDQTGKMRGEKSEGDDERVLKKPRRRHRSVLPTQILDGGAARRRKIGY